MTEDRPIKIFISYAFEEGEKAGLLKKYLSWLGFECFLAHVDIKDGEIWRDSIDEELNLTDAFVPLLTEAALKSAWVHQESGIAHSIKRKKKKKFVIIPLCINKEPPPGCLAIYQARDLKEGWFFGLKITKEEARHIGKNIVKALGRVKSHIQYATARLAEAGQQETEDILEFLNFLGGVTFDDLLIAIKQGVERGTVAHSYRSMVILEEWIEFFGDRFKEVSPDWLAAWNRLKKQYQKHQEEEARRAAESRAMMNRSIDNLSKLSSLVKDTPKKEPDKGLGDP